uniref:ORF1 n=1 Tax=uncultured densovirus TaxID=748192 RepID=A0A7M4CBJ1_9VIRU|nr:ORF1 [uncultured densovirus]
MELVEIGKNVLRQRTIGARFGSDGGRFVRIGGELYAEGSVPLLESTFVNPIYTSSEDIVHFNAETDFIDHSQPFDDIELNTFSESTPLLEAGVGSGIGVVSGGAAASVPSSAIGVGIGVGTAIIGTGLAIGLSGGAVLPGHKNIGPGNEPDPEGVDEDDRIAYRHDVRYGQAETQDDVREADDIAISEFDSDWQNSGNIHSVIGRTGIQIKKAVEDRVGVLYPASLPTGKPWCGDTLLIWIHIVILNSVNVLVNLLAVGVVEPHLFGINGIETGRVVIYLE